MKLFSNPTFRRQFGISRRLMVSGAHRLLSRLDRDHRFDQPRYCPSALPHYRPRPLTCLADAAEMAAGDISRFASQMPENYGQRHNVRKWWEWNHLARCAEELGVLNQKSVGVGLGVGDEPLSFYFANYCKNIIATDLYGSDTNWLESRYEHAESVYRKSPIGFPRDRLEIRNADMRSLGIPDASADFAWSCSSIEHVPTLQDLLVVFDELARVLKVGGYALLTTEFCLTAPPYLLPGVNAMDNNLLGVFADALGAFEFVGATDLSYNFAYPENAPGARRNRPAEQTAIPVGLSVIAPVAFVLKRRKGSNAKWQDLKISQDIREFSECSAKVLAGDSQGVVDRLRPLVNDGPDRLTQQFHHLVFRCYLEAMVHDEAHTEENFVQEILGFMQHLPRGVVQDADCLDLMGHLLGNAGRHDEAAQLYWLCINSPSTCQNHVVEATFDYCRIMKRLGHFGQAVDGIVPVLCALVMVSGIKPNELTRAIQNGAKRSYLNQDDIRYLQCAVEDCLSQSIAKSWTDASAYLPSFDGAAEEAASSVSDSSVSAMKEVLKELAKAGGDNAR